MRYQRVRRYSDTVLTLMLNGVLEILYVTIYR